MPRVTCGNRGEITSPFTCHAAQVKTRPTDEQFMTEEEHAVLAFLESSPEVFFARKVIARKAVKRQVYEETPHWADNALISLSLQGLIEHNDTGQYRCKKSRGSR